jgi:hypothetical protein
VTGKVTKEERIGILTVEGKLRPLPVLVMATVTLPDITVDVSVTLHVVVEPAGTGEVHVNDDND